MNLQFCKLLIDLHKIFIIITECLFPTPVGNNHLITNPHFFDVPNGALHCCSPLRLRNVNTDGTPLTGCHLLRLSE